MGSKRDTAFATPAPERPLPTHGGEWERRGDEDLPVNGNAGRPTDLPPAKEA